MDNAGRVLCGRYRIQHALGSGGMASVWRGEQLSTGQPVAIKLILRELLDTPGAVVRFQTEARAVAQLRSQHVVRLIDYDVDQDAGPFIVMDLLEGETLGARLARGQPPSPPELSRLFTQIAKGLDHAHAAGIVHRDLKPDNIFLVCDDDGALTAKLLDFGVAKVPLAKPSGLTSTGLLVGTVAYMSPEQALGKCVDARSDLWALGAIVYECLVGCSPFAGDGVGGVLLSICTLPLPVPSEVNPGVAPELDAWFAQACARDPADRFASAAQMAAALAPICEKRELARPASGAAATREVGAAVDYHVLSGQVSVGPVDAATLKRGLLAGALEEGDLVWRRGWSEWRPVSILREELAAVEAAAPDTLRPACGVEAIGVPSLPPPGAPSSPPSSRRPLVDPGASYFVTTGETTVGPVTAELLLRGLDAGRVPEGALVWCEGWRRWRAAGLVGAWLREAALLSTYTGPGPALQDLPGLEAIGRRSIAPPSAPPSSVTADEVGPEVEAFHVFDGKTHVGPISGTLLCRAVLVQWVPETAVVWREGWDRWRSIADVVWELAGVRMPRNGPRPAEASLSGLGSPSMLPRGAPAKGGQEDPW